MICKEMCGAFMTPSLLVSVMDKRGRGSFALFSAPCVLGPFLFVSGLFATTFLGL